MYPQVASHRWLLEALGSVPQGPSRDTPSQPWLWAEACGRAPSRELGLRLGLVGHSGVVTPSGGWVAWPSHMLGLQPVLRSPEASPTCVCPSRLRLTGTEPRVSLCHLPISSCRFAPRLRNGRSRTQCVQAPAGSSRRVAKRLWVLLAVTALTAVLGFVGGCPGRKATHQSYSARSCVRPCDQQTSLPCFSNTIF